MRDTHINSAQRQLRVLVKAAGLASGPDTSQLLPGLGQKGCLVGMGKHSSYRKAGLRKLLGRPHYALEQACLSTAGNLIRELGCTVSK